MKANEELTIGESIGKGGFGNVYRAMLKDVAVAVKELKDSGNKDKVEQFIHEASILRQLKHPHIIKFHGLRQTDDKHLIVLEYAPLGSLMSFLASAPNLSWQIKLELANQFTLSVAYLHNNDILHCDIKGDNVLISGSNAEPIAKLTDFGSAKSCGQIASTPSALTPEYCAPEILMDPSQFNSHSEIFSVGCVLGEIATGQRALTSKSSVNRMVKINAALENQHDDFPADTPKDYQSLTQSCWAKDANQRPDATKVNRSLIAMR